MNPFQDGALYEGAISDQFLTKNPSDDLQAIFSVRIVGKLKDEADLAAGVESITPVDRDVMLTFANDDNKLRMVVDQLSKLGFEDSDVEKLHPDHGEFISLVDKKVWVRCRVKGDFVYWNFAWPRPQQKRLELGEVSKSTAGLQQRIAALSKKKRPSSSGSNSVPAAGT